jgi:hypothetical protein
MIFLSLMINKLFYYFKKIKMIDVPLNNYLMINRTSKKIKLPPHQRLLLPLKVNSDLWLYT